MPILVFIPKAGAVEPTGLPTLLIELDTNGWLIGPVLDEALTASLDTAILGPVPPTFDWDITGFFRSGETHRGAQRELQRVEAGTATLTLDNRTGIFTPFNTTGAIGWGD